MAGTGALLKGQRARRLSPDPFPGSITRAQTVKRRVVNWTWEDLDSQEAFAHLVGFPDRQETARQIDRIEALMGLKPPLRVLDVGCGTGRQSIELACRGYTVTGIDVAHSYLEKARREGGRRGAQVEFRLQRGVELQEEAVYDFALAFWHTLGFMTDDEIDEHFRCISRALKPAGRLLLALADPKLIPGMRWEKTREWAEKNGQFILTEQRLKDGYRYERCIVIDTVKEEIIEFREAHRAFALADIQRILQQVGFNQVQCFKDLEGEPATPEEFGVFICNRR